MTLHEMLSLRRGTPLATVPYLEGAGRPVAERLLKVSEQLYVLLSPYQGGLTRGPDGPYITGVVWAADESAVRRALLMDIEADHLLKAEMPSEFLQKAEGSTYAQLLSAAKGSEVCFETAAYRIATDGAFIHQKIETERMIYFFREPQHDPDLQPYAAMSKLRS
jgi:hypothetical protein